MTLEALIKARIRAHGPMPVAEYMALCLSHPEYGYYMHGDPLGAAGDFITAPEIGQLFGELIGLWLAEQWRLLGSPDCALVELGPGRGTLLSDCLRATKPIAGFHDALTLHLVETSPALRQKQAQALAGKHPALFWHATIDDLPEKPLLLIANEFFDALPIRQFTAEGERAVDIGADDALHFTVIPSSFTVIPARPRIHIPEAVVIDSRLRGNDGIHEVSEPALAILHTLSRHIATRNGAALIIDYGYTHGSGNTLQAVRAHRHHDPLADPGSADLTAHVDFGALAQAALAQGLAVHGPVVQGAFLTRLGAAERTNILCENAGPAQKSAMHSALARLISPAQMGELFKVMALTRRNHPMPEGF